MREISSPFWLRVFLLVLALSSKPFGSMEQVAESVVEENSLVPLVRLVTGEGPTLLASGSRSTPDPHADSGLAGIRPAGEPACRGGGSASPIPPVSPHCQRLPYYATPPPHLL